MLQVLLLLLLARALGEAAERLGQSASVGEIATGVLLALIAAWLPWEIDLLTGLAESETLARIADLAIFFLVLLAGVELEPREIAENSAGALAVALGGMVLPLVAGAALAWAALPATDLRQAQALMVGVALSISAIPATVKVLTELGLLHSRLGETVVAAAIFDDVLGLFLLAVLLGLIEGGRVPDLGTLGLLLVKIAGFFAITVALGAHVYPRVRKGLKVMQIAAVEFSALVAVALAYGLLAEVLGLHWVLGAFMAGLYFERARVGHLAYTEMKVTLSALAYGLLGPIFFAFIGLRVDLGALTAIPLLLVLLIAAAFLGKILGAGLPALAIGLPRREALGVGIAMSARGAIELVVLSIAYEAGLFPDDDPVAGPLFSALVLTAVVTTLATPILLRRAVPPNRIHARSNTPTRGA